MLILIFSGILTILIIGFFRIFIKFKSKREDLNFVDEYLEKLDDFIESSGNDLDTYNWLIEKSTKAQSDLGYLGVASQYKPPYANYVFTNYQIIVNSLPELRRALERSSRLSYEYYMTIHETLIRYRGETKLSINNLKKEIRNPIIWFFQGIQNLLSIPFLILNWSGLVSTSFVSKVESNPLFKLISFLAGIVGFISSLITIFDEWELVKSYYFHVISFFQ